MRGPKKALKMRGPKMDKTQDSGLAQIKHGKEDSGQMLQSMHSIYSYHQKYGRSEEEELAKCIANKDVFQIKGRVSLLEFEDATNISLDREVDDFLITRINRVKSEQNESRIYEQYPWDTLAQPMVEVDIFQAQLDRIGWMGTVLYWSDQYHTLYIYARENSVSPKIDSGILIFYFIYLCPSKNR